MHLDLSLGHEVVIAFIASPGSGFTKKAEEIKEKSGHFTEKRNYYI
jgi:hypothetical protein